MRHFTRRLLAAAVLIALGATLPARAEQQKVLRFTGGNGSSVYADFSGPWQAKLDQVPLEVAAGGVVGLAIQPVGQVKGASSAYYVGVALSPHLEGVHVIEAGAVDRGRSFTLPAGRYLVTIISTGRLRLQLPLQVARMPRVSPAPALHPQIVQRYVGSTRTLGLAPYSVSDAVRVPLPPYSTAIGSGQLYLPPGKQTYELTSCWMTQGSTCPEESSPLFGTALSQGSRTTDHPFRSEDLREGSFGNGASSDESLSLRAAARADVAGQTLFNQLVVVPAPPGRA